MNSNLITISVHREYRAMWDEWKKTHKDTNKSRYIMELIKKDQGVKDNA